VNRCRGARLVSAWLPLIAVAAMPASAAVPAEAINACELLQPVEISRLLGGYAAEGRRMDAGMETNGAYSSSCVWVMHPQKPAQPEARLELRGRTYVILNAMQWPAGSGKAGTFLQSFHEAKASGVLTGDLVPKRFGDEALWWGDGLAVRRRDIAFGLSVSRTPRGSEAPGLVEEKLVQMVLPRIDARDTRLGRR
jgi:hypothetical protein